MCRRDGSHEVVGSAGEVWRADLTTGSDVRTPRMTRSPYKPSCAPDEGRSPNLRSVAGGGSYSFQGVRSPPLHGETLFFMIDRSAARSARSTRHRSRTSIQNFGPQALAAVWISFDMSGGVRALLACVHGVPASNEGTATAATHEYAADRVHRVPPRPKGWFRQTYCCQDHGTSRKLMPGGKVSRR